MKKLQNVVLSFLLLSVLHGYSQQWYRMPLVTDQTKALGNIGGEGCQVISSIAYDGTGNTLLMGTDVGGLYRSLNGGALWEPCNVGYKPRGCNYVAIDPHNNNRFLVSAGNSTSFGNWHGIWLSTNQGDSWTNTLPKTHAIDASPGRGYDQIAYDPSSFSNGKTNIVYWSCPSDAPTGTGGLFKSIDGGQTWSQLRTDFGGTYIKCHPTNGILYAGNSTGLYKSTDGGLNFIQLKNYPIYGLDVTKANPNWIYIVSSYKIELSKDNGVTWATKAGTNLPTSAWNNGIGWSRIHASPVNSDLLTISHETGHWADVHRYYSKDGGNTWSKPTFDASNSFIPSLAENRTERPAFHPTNENIIISNGGDWIAKSVDGGANYVWSNNGYSGIMNATIFNFNPFYPDLLLMVSQDYNSALTTNGGSSWKYVNPSGHGWGGFQYGGYAIDPLNLVAGNADCWGCGRELTTSKDGGKTWTKKGIFSSGYSAESGCGDPGDPNVAFWNDYRTADKGSTWTKMTGCERVYTYNLKGAMELYGVNGRYVVKSTDHGLTWVNVCEAPNSWLNDIAYDHINNRIYMVTDIRTLYYYDVNISQLREITGNLPQDNNGSRKASTVAVDPIDPSIVYIGNHADIYATDVAVAKSIDAGATWVSLTKKPGGKGLDGGREASVVRVNPVDRSLWVAGQCYGNWRYGTSDNSKPAVTITSPKINSTQKPGSNLQIVAEGVAPSGISKIEFYNGTSKLGEDATSPYTFDWINLAAGNYTITAKIISINNDVATSAEVSFSVVESQNIIPNFGFETGTMSAWIGYGTSSIVNNNTHTGSFAASVGSTASTSNGVYQIITNLKPNTTYVLSAWAKVSQSTEGIYIGVKNYGGSQVVNYMTSSTYSKSPYITFTTGPSNTEAEIFAYKGAGSPAFVDDFELREQDHPNVNITSPLRDQVFNTPATITFKAEATDQQGIRKVEFYLANNKIGEDSVKPYSITYQISTSGTYYAQVKVMDSTNMVSTSNSVYFTVGKINGFSFYNSEENIVVYPNPATDDIYISCQGMSSISEVELLDIYSRPIVIQDQLKQNGNVLQLQLSNYPEGMYFLKITTSTESLLKKIQINR